MYIYHAILYHAIPPCHTMQHIYIYIYHTVLYHAIPPCHTMHTLTYHNTIPCTPHHIYIYIYTIQYPLAIFPVPYSLCPITYINYSQSTIFSEVAKKWSRECALVSMVLDAPCKNDIGFCCIAGIHRAPAAARVVREMLKRDGFATSGPLHLSKESWKARNICSGCVECAVDNSLKQALFDIAYAKWRTYAPA